MAALCRFSSRARGKFSEIIRVILFDMALSSKLRVGVLRGGPSFEHEISLKTGAHVLKNLSEKYFPVDIFVDKAGAWHVQGVATEPQKVLRKVDVLWNALHGEYGEDGTLQYTLDAFGTPYTGSKRLASALAMHKTHAKNFLKKYGIKSPYHKILKKEEASREVVRELFKLAPNPSIVKPVGSGSSIGVSVSTRMTEFEAAVEKAFVLSSVILIEEYIKGREATCGVIDAFRGEDIYALLPAEFVHSPGVAFLDYEAKYGEKSRTVYPGRFSQAEKDAIQTAARVAHKVLGLRHYSRSDFIVSPKRGVYFLEVNSLPGLYADAPYVESLRALGVQFSSFLDHVLRLALRGE